MTVEDMIEELKKYPKDMEVVIQYRDDGGFYYGYDSDICFDVEKGMLVL